MRLTKLVVLAAALLILPVRSAHANLIVNGSFEDPNIPTGTFALLSSIPGWTSTLFPIEIQDNVAGSPYAGNQHIELDSSGNGIVNGAGVVTNIGQIYKLSFAYSPRPGYALNTNGVDLYVDGLLTASLAANGIGNPNTVWTVYEYNVVGDGLTQVEFRGAGISDSLGGYIDDVQLVPEPASMLLLGIGVVGTGLKRRARKKQQ